MSGVNPARLNSAKSSTQALRLRHHLSAAGVLMAQLVGLSPNFDQVLENGIIAVPLHKVGATHKGAVLGGPSVIVPQIEVFELDRVFERVRRDQIVGIKFG